MKAYKSRSRERGRHIAVALLSLVVLFAVACSEEQPGDDNVSETFGDECTLAASKCVKPFTCIADAGAPTGRCTLTCVSDEQCPSWEATGHCAGPTRARCWDGVCQRPLCK